MQTKPLNSLPFQIPGNVCSNMKREVCFPDHCITRAEKWKSFNLCLIKHFVIVLATMFSFVLVILCTTNIIWLWAFTKNGFFKTRHTLQPIEAMMTQDHIIWTSIVFWAYLWHSVESFNVFLKSFRGVRGTYNIAVELFYSYWYSCNGYFNSLCSRISNSIIWQLILNNSCVHIINSSLH